MAKEKSKPVEQKPAATERKPGPRITIQGASAEDREFAERFNRCRRLGLIKF